MAAFEEHGSGEEHCVLAHVNEQGVEVHTHPPRFQLLDCLLPEWLSRFFLALLGVTLSPATLSDHFEPLLSVSLFGFTVALSVENDRGIQVVG